MSNDYVVVNKAFLDSTMADTADIIRSILGVADPIPWENDVGFRRALIEVEELLNEVRGLGDSVLDRTLTELTNNRITTLGANALRQCASLTSVTLNNIQTTGTSALYSCTALQRFVAPTLKSIGSATFQGDTALVNLQTPSVETIANRGLMGCAALEKLNLPNLEDIATEAFANCSKLVALVLGAPCTLANTNAFNGTPIASGSGYVYVPRVYLDLFKNGTNWSTFAAKIRVKEDYPDIVGG